MNRLDSLKNCVVDTKSVVSDVTDVISLIKSGDEWAAVTSAAKIAMKLKGLTSTCPGAPAEVKALGEWFLANMSSKEKMTAAASANSHIHSQEIYLHVETLWVNMYGPTGGFAPQNFPALGKSIGDVAYWALGPVIVPTANDF